MAGSYAIAAPVRAGGLNDGTRLVHVSPFQVQVSPSREKLLPYPPKRTIWAVAVS